MKRNPIAAPVPEAKGVEVTIANDVNIETMNRTHKASFGSRNYFWLTLFHYGLFP